MELAVAKDVFSIIGTAVSACGVIAAIVFGCIGLSTWRRQAKGSNDHELSRKILLGLYKYREAINRVRYPTFRKHEMNADSGQDENVDQEILRFRRLAKMYEQRLDEVISCRSDLEVYIVEGDALWGGSIAPFFEAINAMEVQLFQYVNTYLYSINPEAPLATREACSLMLSRMPDVLYDDLSKEGDEYRRDMGLKVREFQSYLLGKMIR